MTVVVEVVTVVVVDVVVVVVVADPAVQMLSIQKFPSLQNPRFSFITKYDNISFAVGEYYSHQGYSLLQHQGSSGRSSHW